MTIQSVQAKINQLTSQLQQDFLNFLDSSNAALWEFDHGTYGKEKEDTYYLRTKDKRYSVYVLDDYTTVYFGQTRIFTEDGYVEQPNKFIFWKKRIEVDTPLRDKIEKIYDVLLEEAKLRTLEDHLAHLNGLHNGGISGD